MTLGSTSLVLRGTVGGRERSYLLGEGTCLIGRHPRCGVVLGVSGVSKRHALVEVELDRIWLEDLDSKNGTFLGDQRIEEARVRVGDRLRFGPVTLQVDVLEADALAIDLGEGDAPLGVGPGGVESSLLATGALGTGVGAGRGATGTMATGSGRVRSTARLDGLVLPEGWVAGVSRSMRRFLEQVPRVSLSQLPVLIVGETGVGKEGVAQAVHASSPRAGGPFVALNCAAIPGDLLEAELFGVRAGAATGVSARPGRFAQAEGGTLFLDELGEMPAALQAKLLRALQEREVVPVGGEPRSIDVRVVAATNIDLEASIEAGRFRRDLYYRLAGCVLRVPALAEREDDIPVLVEAFLRRAVDEGPVRVRGLTRSALRRLCERAWPGNVRELRHAVERLVFLADESEVIDEARVEEVVGGAEREPPSLPTLHLAELEALAVAEAMRRADGHQTRAAELLGISRTALYRRLAKPAADL